MKELIDLKRGDCRWPIGTPRPGTDDRQMFCAGPAMPKRPYCPACNALAYEPEQPGPVKVAPFMVAA